MPRWLLSIIASRAFASAALALLVAGLGVWLLAMPVGRAFEQASYDVSLSWLGGARPPAASAPVAVVFLDLDSFRSRNLDPREPWPRSLHAQLLDRLTTAGARAVVFDILFDRASDDSIEDRRLRDAIARNGRVILAAETIKSGHATDPGNVAWEKSLKLSLPAPYFLEKAAGWGLSDVRPDDDVVVRRHRSGWPGDELARPSLSWAAGRLLQLADTAAGFSGNERLLRYYGGPLSIPHVTFSQAVDATAVPDSFFKDRIVFIGARPMSGQFSDRRDEYRSPIRLRRESDVLIPGVEVHATQMLNLVQRDWLVRPPPWVELLAVLCVGVSLGSGLVWLRPLPATMAACGVALGTAAGAAAGVRIGNSFVPWLVVVGAQIPAALAGTVLVHWAEWFRTRRRLEAQRRADEARIREQAALIGKAHDAILVQDLDGRTRYANPSAERLYGWTSAELQSGTSTSLFDADSAREARRLTLAAGEWSGELRQTSRDGRALTLDSRWTLIRTDDGQPKSLLIISSDVTERRQLEAEAHRAQRTEAIGSLAAGMAHDLNNSLSPVLLGAQLLRREVDSDSGRRLLDLIESGAQRGAGMVKQVLLFARGREGQFERLNPRALVGDMARLAKDTFPKSIHVIAEYADDIWDIRGNPTEIHQVLLNLCVNARDAMPGGGSLSLAVENVVLDATDAGRFEGGTPGAFVSILVTDTGTGIPAQVLPRIFDAFFTTKPEGKSTGLGLSTALRILRSHGGAIRVSSQAGEGTAFEVLLPRLENVSSGRVETSAPVVPRGTGQRILLVDDDAAIIELLRRGLVEHGFQVETSIDAANALRAARHAGSGIHLVVCDASIPAPEGGMLIDILRAELPTVPLLPMTGGDLGLHPTESRVTGTEALRKPLEWQTALETIHRQLHRH